MRINSVFSAHRHFWVLAVFLAAVSTPVWAFFDDFPDIKPGFGSRTSAGISGGKINANIYQSQDRDCVGWIDDTPDHTIYVTSTVEVSVGVRRLKGENELNPTLVIICPGNDPVCANTGANGFEVGIRADFYPGEYQVFIGSYNKDVYGQYEFYLLER